MRDCLTRGALAAALTLSLGVAGCGGAGPGSDEAVVVTEPGKAVSTAGSGTAPAKLVPTPSASAPAAASTNTAAPAASTSAVGWGTLKGQVVFGGSPPDVPVLEEKGKAEKNPEFCAKDAPIKSERLVVDKDSKGVKNVLVYFPKPTAVNEEAKSSKAEPDVVFDQVKCVFAPHVLAFMAGQKVTLKSSDEVNHNVNAKLLNNGVFNSLFAAGQSAPFVASTRENSPSSVTCDIHPWMQAWWLILDNPYFAVTDEKGNFEIKNAPAGAQKVVVWQEATGFVTAPSGEVVTIAANDTTPKTWTIDPAKVKPAK